MSFLHPAGLWLLVGIPILIIIFLIRSHHEDRQVSSAYIWKISDKFRKNRVPLQIFRRILLLILQILAVLLLTALAARPVITDELNSDYILIFDASGSMLTENADGLSRFDEAKKRAETYAKKVSGGHTVSVICASDVPFCPLTLSGSKNEVEMTLQNLTCSYGGCDIDAAFSLANDISKSSSDPKIVFYTDRICEDFDPQRIEIVDLANARSQSNLSLMSVRASKIDAGLSFKGELSSYGFDGVAIVALKVDGEIVDAREVECRSGENSEFVFDTDKSGYERAEVFIQGDDGLEEDNSYVLTKYPVRQRKILLVSEAPFFIEKALKSIEGCQVVRTSSLKNAELSGYDLYIFDGIAPSKLPEDGSSVFMHPDILPLGVSLGERVYEEASIKRADSYDGELFESWEESQTVVKNYFTIQTGGAWQTVLTINGKTAGAVKEQSNGLTVSVFSFDLHDTNLPLQAKYMSFIFDIVEFAAPSIIKKSAYDFGENVRICSAPYVESVYVSDAEEHIRELSINSGKSDFLPSATGVYTAVQTFGESGAYADFFVHIPESESSYDSIESLPEIMTGDTSKAERDATFEITFWIAVAMLILLLAEWGVYYYEQL